MSYRTWREIGIIQPSTTGTAVDLDVFPLPTKSSYHVIQGFTNYSTPDPILALSFVEGTDFPFFTRDSTVRDTRPPFSSEIIRSGVNRSVQSTMFFLGLSFPVFTAPPDTQPLTMGRIFETPEFAYTKRRIDNWKLSGRATADAPGYWNEFIPASLYTDISCRVMSEIQRHMLEGTIDNGFTWSLWTQTEVLGFFNQRFAEFLVETGVILTHSTQAVSAGAISVDLPMDLMDTRRVAWNNTGLVRIDPWALDGGSVGWQTSTGVPYAYIEEPLDPLTIRLVPIPALSGTLDLIYVPVPDAVTSTCAPLPFPNFITPYIKYGVMADMFAKEGEASDPDRATYCEQRYQEGIEMAKMFLGVK